MIKKILIFLILSLLSLNSVQASTLFDFNEGSGHTLPGWTWWDGDDTNTNYPPPNNLGANGYGAPGWDFDDGEYLGFKWGPRIFRKGDYGNDNDASIDTSTRSPATSTGGSLHVFDTGLSEIYQACWYFQWPRNFGYSGYADESTNRMSFYFKPAMPNANSGLGTTDPSNGNIHIGTYICCDGCGSGGESCPNEAGNSHYYHYLTINPGTWIHVQLDNNPQIQRGMGTAPIDPAYSEYGVHYYEGMNSFYVEIRRDQESYSEYWIDEMVLWTQEVEENDISISSTWVGYWAATGKWELGFMDDSFDIDGRDATTHSTFEIRYSAAPITNANYNDAAVAEPEYFERGVSNTWRRGNPWARTAWNRFELPNDFEEGKTKIYFAIKDVSLLANGDGHDSPSALIKTIDYSLSADQAPEYEQPTIAVQDTNTGTSSSGTITGTYMIDSELSPGLCTWSHSGGSVTGFATVLLGVVSGTVTSLPVGATTVAFSLLDSEDQEATDTATFTRSETTSHSLGKGFYSNGINFK